MKTHVEQGAAEFLVEMAQVPDLLQLSTSRLKRRVKGLYQVVSDLELPVASVLSLRLQCTSKVAGAAGQPLHQPASEEACGEQIQQQRALQSYTQVGLSGVETARVGTFTAATILSARAARHFRPGLKDVRPITIYTWCRLGWVSLPLL